MSMTRTTALALGLVVLAMSAVGCQNKIKEENALLNEEVQDLRGTLEQRNAALDAANRELRSLEQDNTRLRRQLDDARAEAKSQPPAMRTGFENIPGVTGSSQPGQVTATVESDILFDSGKASLKSQAKQSLNAVASVLNSQYSGRPIRIEGHTDTDPIRKSGFKSNYHLGFARAYAVFEHLQTRGIDRNRMHVASFGPHKPKSTKAKSRRVEIIVLLNDQQVTSANQ